nr:flavonol sulfotransferase-like protein [Ipomoea batatas]
MKTEKPNEKSADAEYKDAEVVNDGLHHSNVTNCSPSPHFTPASYKAATMGASSSRQIDMPKAPASSTTHVVNLDVDPNHLADVVETLRNSTVPSVVDEVVNMEVGVDENVTDQMGGRVPIPTSMVAVADKSLQNWRLSHSTTSLRSLMHAPAPNSQSHSRCFIDVAYDHDTVVPEITQSVLWLDTTYNVWENLKERFYDDDMFRITSIQQEIFSIKQGEQSVSNYFTKFKLLWDELLPLRSLLYCLCNPKCNCGCLDKIKEHHRMEQVTTFLRGLNECYSSVKSQIMLMTPLPMIGKECAFVQQQEQEVMRTSQSEATGDTNDASENEILQGINELELNNSKSGGTHVTSAQNETGINLHEDEANLNQEDEINPIQGIGVNLNQDEVDQGSQNQSNANGTCYLYDCYKPDNSPAVSSDGQAADDLDYMSSGYNILANSDQEVSSHAESSAQNAFPSPTQSVSSMQLDPQTNLEQSPEQNDVGSQLNCLPSQQ